MPFPLSAGVKHTDAASRNATLVELGVGGLWLPEDVGLIGWSGDPEAATNAGSALTGGTLYVSRIPVRGPGTFGGVRYGVATAGATLTAAQNLVGVYNNATSLIWTSSDRATDWLSAAFKDLPVSSGTPSTAPAFVAGYLDVVFLSQGTTKPAFTRGTSQSSGMAVGGGGSGHTFRHATADTARTTLPASLGAETASAQTPFVLVYGTWT